MKQISVHMSVHEYEQYKKYLELQQNPHGILIYMGHSFYGMNVFNETELIEVLEDKIKNLEMIVAEKNEKIYQLEKRKPSWWRSLWT